MTISLTAEQERAIKRQLAKGRFTSEDEVISEALSLLEQQDDVLAEVRQAYREAHKENVQLEPDEAIRKIEQEIVAFHTFDSGKPFDMSPEDIKRHL